jgi:hypothetical protein
MLTPDISPAFRRVLDHYAQSLLGAYDQLTTTERVQIEDEVLVLEKEIFASECNSQFGTVRDLLVSASPSDRIAAVMILYRGDCSDDATLRLLIERLSFEDDPATLQHLILWFRYRHKDARALGAICRLNSHPDHMVRTCVADALGAYCDNNEAVETLRRLTHDPHPNVCEAAREELPGSAA